MAIPASASGGNFGTAPGSRVGGARYLLKRLVGRGEFSELWLARDVKGEKDVALKVLPKAFLQDENLLEHIRQDVRRNGLLKHPHIVSVYELVTDNNTAAIAMEFMDGWSLATMKVDKLGQCHSPEEIGPWIREACDALAYAHNEFGMVHGDLKPSNLLTSTREGIKVSDFGFAALIRTECSKRGIIKSGYGGIGFLSPQQVMGEPPSKLDDIYSLGATIFDLLTGTPPFYKGEVIAQICSLKAPRMAQRLAELSFQSDPLPVVWEETVAACLAKNPADRPQSVEDVLQMLEGKPIQRISHADDEDENVPPVLESAAAQTAPPPVPAEQIKIPSQLEQAPVGQTSSKLIALAFAGVVALFLIAALAVAVIHFSKIFNIANVVSGNPEPQVTTTVLVDTNFNAGTGTDNTIRCMALQQDGKILIAGLFTNFNGVAAEKIVRLTPDGSVDTTFTPHVPGNVYAIALQPDGQILIGGQGLWAKHPARKFIRLEPDGSRDGRFHGESAYNSDVRAITIQPDGGTLVGGSFTKVATKEHHGLVRLNANDQIDDSFNTSTAGSAVVLSIAALPDGKILAAGIFNNFGNSSQTHLVRLSSDGSVDATFNDAAYADKNIRQVLLQKDGKVLACGFSMSINNTASPYITRLNADGSTDPGFHFTGQPGDAFWSMALQPDGKILIGGYNETNKEVSPIMTRLNPDGSPDKSFQISDLTGNCIWGIIVQPDGKILVAGAINSLGGTPCGNILRLQN
ncbi:MAG TPA: protein kinase [Pseudomonadales bacterium]|nr:protein kinase [Pseudomonadales bacterium]